MKKVIVKEKPLTRQSLADPHIDITYEERLIKSGAINLKNNCFIEDLENGYVKIIPIDINNKFV